MADIKKDGYPRIPAGDLRCLGAIDFDGIKNWTWELKATGRTYRRSSIGGKEIARRDVGPTSDTTSKKARMEDGAISKSE